MEIGIRKSKSEWSNLYTNEYFYCCNNYNYYSNGFTLADFCRFSRVDQTTNLQPKPLPRGSLSITPKSVYIIIIILSF